jgi:hypothetical protein
VKKQCLCAGVLLFAFTASSPAALPSGAFNFNGSLVVTQNTITWISNGGVCTLSNTDGPGGSAFITASGGVPVDASTSQWSMHGVTSDGQAWNGVWISHFLEPYQVVVNTFLGPAGSVANTYSAAASIVVVPEPALTALIGAGLIALSFGVRRPRKH